MEGSDSFKYYETFDSSDPRIDSIDQSQHYRYSTIAQEHYHGNDGYNSFSMQYHANSNQMYSRNYSNNFRNNQMIQNQNQDYYNKQFDSMQCKPLNRSHVTNTSNTYGIKPPLNHKYPNVHMRSHNNDRFFEREVISISKNKNDILEDMEPLQCFGCGHFNHKRPHCPYKKYVGYVRNQFKRRIVPLVISDQAPLKSDKLLVDELQELVKCVLQPETVVSSGRSSEVHRNSNDVLCDLSLNVVDLHGDLSILDNINFIDEE